MTKRTQYIKTHALIKRLVKETRQDARKTGPNSWLIPKLGDLRISFNPKKKGNIDSYIQRYYECIFNIEYIEKVTLMATHE